MVSNIQLREVELNIKSPRVNNFGTKKNDMEYLSYSMRQMSECQHSKFQWQHNCLFFNKNHIQLQHAGAIIFTLLLRLL